MISFSVKSKYGLTAVFALAQLPLGSPMQSKQLSERFDIPQAYLEQLLLSLKKSGIIKSLRGCNGGYVLARPAQDVTVYDILVCLEGPPRFCDTACGPLQKFWQSKEARIQDLFSVSIADLVMNAQKNKNCLAYTI